MNVDHVRELESLLRIEYGLTLRSGHRVVTGRTFSDRVRELLGLSG